MYWYCIGMGILHTGPPNIPIKLGIKYIGILPYVGRIAAWPLPAHHPCGQRRCDVHARAELQPPSPLQRASCRVPAPIQADACDGHWHEYARRQCTGLVLLVQIDKTSQNNIETTKCKELSLQMQVIGQGESSIELYVRSGLFMGCTVTSIAFERTMEPSRKPNPNRPSCNPGSSSGPACSRP